MRVAMLSPIAWRTPPRHYGPWEYVVGLLTDALVAQGIDATLFATGDSMTQAKLASVCPKSYNEEPAMNPKVWECLHIANVFERADEFDIIHNHFDFLPLSYCALVDTPMVTTIHGFSSPKILPVFKKYNRRCHYIAISDADRNAELDYLATIHHGIDVSQFPVGAGAEGYLLFFGRIHPDKGTKEAIQIAARSGIRLVIAGIVQDQAYFENEVAPHIDGSTVEYLGAVEADKRAEVLGNAHALLHIANFDEPFGLSLIEAMACGTPVIATRRGAIPELIIDGETGFIVDSVDEATDAVRRINSLDRFRCREHVESHFTHQRMAKNYAAAYQQILDGRENHRPWGHYANLSESDTHKVKQLHVVPGGRMSLQKHERRAEHWTVVNGQALVTVGDREQRLNCGQSIDVPLGSVHRISNPGPSPLTIVETQLGDYFGEDDIIRLSDDYGRS